VKQSLLSMVMLAAVWQGSALSAEPAAADAAAVEPAAAMPASSVAKPAGAPASAPHGAVQTSNAAAAAKPATKPAVAPRKGAAVAHAHDQIELDATQVTGNRELPNVMYVVPWKKPDLGDFAGRPPKSLLDELLAPVDREVFQRQNRYFAALQPDAAASGAAPAAPGAQAPRAAAPVSGPADAPVSGDVK